MIALCIAVCTFHLCTHIHAFASKRRRAWTNSDGFFLHTNGEVVTITVCLSWRELAQPQMLLISTSWQSHCAFYKNALKVLMMLTKRKVGWLTMKWNSRGGRRSGRLSVHQRLFSEMQTRKSNPLFTAFVKQLVWCDACPVAHAVKAHPTLGGSSLTKGFCKGGFSFLQEFANK